VPVQQDTGLLSSSEQLSVSVRIDRQPQVVEVREVSSYTADRRNSDIP
jgi:hypothetical protein